jgi:hypothetical protein
VFAHTHTPLHGFSGLRISLFAFLMMLSMTMFGQNYGNFQANQIPAFPGSMSISLGNGTIDQNTRFSVNTADQNGADIRATGFSKKALSLYTSGYGSTALDVQSTHSQSFAARFTGNVYFLDKVGIGTTPLTMAAHEKLAIRNGMITTSGTGNGISLNGSYYGSTPNDFGTQRYGLFMGNPASMKLSTDQIGNYSPIVLSSFYGLGFDVGGGKMALCQNGALYIGGSDAATKTRIQSTADLDAWALEYQLYVEKGIRTEKVKVDVKNGNWPDFVFEDNYTLPSLMEVEQFITTNKHLPNVPSAEEVETEGIDLGEMDKILLQKIEELTLYTIEQQKQLELLKKELELLKK